MGRLLELSHTQICVFGGGGGGEEEEEEEAEEAKGPTKQGPVCCTCHHTYTHGRVNDTFVSLGAKRTGGIGIEGIK